MNIRNKRITFASVLALQAAAFCFATNSFACNRVTIVKNITGASEEEAKYIVHGSGNHTVIAPEKMLNRLARAEKLHESGVLDEYVRERLAGKDKQQTVLDMRVTHALDPDILDSLNVVQALSHNAPVVVHHGLHGDIDLAFNRVFANPLDIIADELTTRAHLNTLLNAGVAHGAIDIALVRGLQNAVVAGHEDGYIEAIAGGIAAPTAQQAADAHDLINDGADPVANPTAAQINGYRLAVLAGHQAAYIKAIAAGIAAPTPDDALDAHTLINGGNANPSVLEIQAENLRRVGNNENIVFNRVYTVGGAPLVNADEGDTRNAIRALLGAGVLPATIDAAYMAAAEQAYLAIHAVHGAVNDINQVIAWVTADNANGEQVALRAHIAAGGDRLAAYTAIAATGRVPRDAEVLAWVAVANDGDRVANRAHIVAGGDRLAAYNAILANRAPTNAEVLAWVAVANDGDRVANRAHIAAGGDRLAAYTAIRVNHAPTNQQIIDYVALNAGNAVDNRGRALIVLDLDHTDGGIQAAYDAIAANHAPTAQQINDYVALNAGNAVDNRGRALIVLDLDHTDGGIQAAYDHFVTVGDGAIDPAKIGAVVGVVDVAKKLAAALAVKHGLDETNNGILNSVKRLTDIVNPVLLPQLTADYVNVVRDNMAFNGGPAQAVVADFVNQLAQAGRFNLNDGQIKAAYAHAIAFNGGGDLPGGLADWLLHN